LTREEAVEISRNTWDVQEVFNWGYRVRYNLKVKYWDTTYIATVKRNHPGSEWEKNLPDDHGVWEVHWYITAPEHYIVHYIDEFTGRIVFGSSFAISDRVSHGKLVLAQSSECCWRRS